MVLINGKVAYDDGSRTAGERHYIPFPELRAGDVLGFEVYDTYGDCTGLSPLYLTCSPGGAVLATPGFNQGCGHPVRVDPVYVDSFTVPDLCQTLSVTVNPIKVADSGATVNATATILGPTYAGVPGKIVSFSLSPGLGTLSTPAKLTNASGIATVQITTPKTPLTVPLIGKVMVLDEDGNEAQTVLTILPSVSGLPDGLTPADTVRRPAKPTGRCSNGCTRKLSILELSPPLRSRRVLSARWNRAV